MQNVEMTDTFDAWFELQSRVLKEDMLATMLILSEFGPQLGRPYVDTVKDSTFQNMRGPRIQHHGSPICAFFAFDLLRKAIALCAGDKNGMNKKRLYKEATILVDREFSQHLTKER